MRIALIVLLLAIASFPASLLAADNDSYNFVHLNAQASSEIDNDRLVAELYAEAQSADASRAASEVNAAISWAVAEAKKIAGIEVTTLDYRTNALYEKTRIKGWRATQSLRLESSDSEKISQLITQLQEKLKMQRLNYLVSDAAQHAAETELTESAIEAFLQRATIVTRAFGYKKFRVVDVSINSGNMHPPTPYYRGPMMAMEAKSADAAVIEAGSSTLTVTASGKIQLY